MNKKTIVFEDYIAEHVAAAAMEFAASALNGAVHKIIQESGAITKNEVATIEKMYEKIVTEAIEEFVPSEEELQQMIETLEKAGYKVVKTEEEAAENGDVENEDEEEAAENGDVEDRDEDEAAENGGTLNESADLASKIAAKLEIL
ncbi:MAG TPA: hypothetical protein EYP33_08365 [Pyrodictium sp.]|nr:hypothetical protein [Pyrodictium sp.]